MTLAPQELENNASKQAGEAIRLDSQGSRGMAIQHYQGAVDSLLKLVRLYPEYNLNRIYVERAKTYQNRIKALQESRGFDEGDNAPTPHNGNGNGRSSGAVETLKASFDDLILKDRPKISWDEVVGLEDAKRALNESIIYPAQRPDLFPLGWLPRGQ